MTKPYTPVPKHARERLEIAILCGEQMQLQWADEANSRAYLARVTPLGIEEQAEQSYLTAATDEGEQVRIRLDLIRNLPTPMK